MNPTLRITRRSVLGAAAAVAAATAVTACSSNSSSSGSSGSGSDGSVYYLNFKPESDSVWQDIAKEYTDQTGVAVKVVTAASGTYESTLKAEVSKSEAPTLFQVNGPVGLQTWQDYCAELDDSEMYKDLIDQSMALTADGKVYGVPYVEEGYGIIYNQAIMDRYFALSGAKASSMDEIKNFDKLKEVADDMQARKDELGIDGVFASTSLKSGEDWRWQTHLANIPVYYEYQDAGVDDMDEVTFKYNQQFKNIFDLYLTDSTVDKELTPSKAVTDSMSEFALGQCAMVQNGDWAWSQIDGVDGNTVNADDVKFMPIYTGHEGEENQGLCIGTENYLAVNAKVSEADQQATLDFVNWLITSDEGKKHMVEDLGFISPFNTFSDDEEPDDPLAKQIIEAMKDSDKTTVPWVFTTFPSQQFKNDFGEALAAYAAGTESWDDVVDTFVTEWKEEKNA